MEHSSRFSSFGLFTVIIMKGATATYFRHIEIYILTKRLWRVSYQQVPYQDHLTNDNNQTTIRILRILICCRVVQTTLICNLWYNIHNSNIYRGSSKKIRSVKGFRSNMGSILVNNQKYIFLIWYFFKQWTQYSIILHLLRIILINALKNKFQDLI